MKKELEVTTTATLTNTRTLILINALLVILVLVSLGVSFYTLGFVKENSSTDQKTEEKEIKYDVSMFKSIDTNKFIELFKGEDKSLVYLGRSTCGFCVKFLPILQKAQKEYEYKTYYLDITTVDKNGVKKLQELDNFLKENYGYTPMVLVIQDGKILNKEVNNYNGVGYTEYKTFEKFLKNLDYEK